MKSSIKRTRISETDLKERLITEDTLKPPSIDYIQSKEAMLSQTLVEEIMKEEYAIKPSKLDIDSKFEDEYLNSFQDPDASDYSDGTFVQRFAHGLYILFIDQFNAVPPKAAKYYSLVKMDRSSINVLLLPDVKRQEIMNVLKYCSRKARQFILEGGLGYRKNTSGLRRVILDAFQEGEELFCKNLSSTKL